MTQCSFGFVDGLSRPTYVLYCIRTNEDGNVCLLNPVTNGLALGDKLLRHLFSSTPCAHDSRMYVEEEKVLLVEGVLHIDERELFYIEEAMIVTSSLDIKYTVIIQSMR